MENVATFPVTAAMLQAVQTNFDSAVSVAVPVGVAIMAVMIGIRYIPRIIKAFKG